MKWFDIGVNLTDPRLPNEITCDAASLAGVSHMAIIGTDLDSSSAALHIAQQRPELLVCTAGIHPHYAKDAPADFTDKLAQLARYPQVVAVGECGLDFNRNFSPAVDQLRVFEAQLALACELKLPVLLHERDAFNQQIALLKKYHKDLVGGVAHCFTGDSTQMRAYLELGLYIGVTGWVCDPQRGQSLRDAVKQLPPERLLLETDAPYLFPKTLKPRQANNEPANLPHIGRQVAQLMALDEPSVAQHSYHNAMALFGLVEPVE